MWKFLGTGPQYWRFYIYTHIHTHIAKQDCKESLFATWLLDHDTIGACNWPATVVVSRYDRRCDVAQGISVRLAYVTWWVAVALFFFFGVKFGSLFFFSQLYIYIYIYIYMFEVGLRVVCKSGPRREESKG